MGRLDTDTRLSLFDQQIAEVVNKDHKEPLSYTRHAEGTYFEANKMM